MCTSTIARVELALGKGRNHTVRFAGHHAALGEACHASRRLLTDVLRSDLGIPGPLLSDCNDIGALRPITPASYPIKPTTPHPTITQSNMPRPQRDGAGALVAFRVASNLTHAASIALAAGVDLDLQCGRHCPTPPYSQSRAQESHTSHAGRNSNDGGSGCGAFSRLGDAMGRGMVQSGNLKRSVTRLLAAKWSAGLMNAPFVSPLGSEGAPTARPSIATRTGAGRSTRGARNMAQERLARTEEGAAEEFDAPGLDGPESRALAREAAERGMVLVRNDAELLPLRGSAQAVGLVGPLAGCGIDGEGGPPGNLCDSQRNMLGGYASPLSRGRVRVDTVVRAFRFRAAGMGRIVRFARGANIDDEDTRLVAEAVAVARQSDVVVAVLGDSVETAGEWADRASLEMPGGQRALLQALIATGVPLVLVLFSGRPVTFGGSSGDDLLTNVSALLTSYPPGQMGSEALARLLFGDVPPGGKLAFSWPRRPTRSDWLLPRSGKWLARSWGVGQSEARWHGTYIDASASPLFSFGHGLTYSTTVLEELSVRLLQPRGGLHVARAQVRVRNVGRLGASEVVQCYARDPIMRHVRRQKRLVGFTRVELDARGSRLVEVLISADAMAMLDDEQRWRVVPGEYQISCGRSSVDPDGLVVKLNL